MTVKLSQNYRLVFNIVGSQFNKLQKYWVVYDEVIDNLSTGFNDTGVAAAAHKKALAQSGLTQKMYEYVTSLGVTSAAELTFTQKLRLSTMALWEQAAAWAASPLGMATIAAASIFLIVKAVDWLTVSLEESREKLAELKEEYNDNEGELTTLNDELQTTIDRINELQGKDSLTFTEAEELENLQRQNSELKTQIALLETIQKQKNREKNKTFVETMDKDLGNKKEFATNYKYASSNYTPQFGTGSVSAGGLTTRTMSEMDLLNSALVRYNELYNEWNNASDKDKEKIKKDLDDVQKYLTDKAAELASAAEGISYISNPTTDDEKAVNNWLDFINDFNDKLMITMGQSGAKENALNRLIFGSFSNATSELKELGKQGQVTAEHLKDPKYDEFIAKCIDLGIITEENEEGLAFLALGFNTLSSAESNAASSTALVTSAIERMEKALEQLNKVADNGQSSISSLSDAMTKLHNGALTVSEVIDLIQDFPELAPFVDLDADGYGNLHEGLLEMVKKTAQETKEELLALKISGDLSEEEARSIDVLCEAIDQLANDALNNVAPKIDSFVGSLSKLQKSASGLDLLGGIYADVADGETFDWTAILNNEDFTEQFGGLGDAYSNFIKTVSTSNGDLKSCQAAFNELTTAYIMNSGALNDVTADTRDASIALLEEMGVANAAALVDAKIADNLVYLSEQTRTYVRTLLAEEEVLWDECEAGSAAAQSLANLVQQKLAFNSSSINTTNDINQLMNMAKYANATAASIQRLAKAEEFMSKYYEMKDKNYSLAVSFLHQANALLAQPIEYEKVNAKIEAEVEYSGGSEYLKKMRDEAKKAKEDAEKAREEALKNAKSSIDELVDYRIDMLKKDIELEKDALNDKLDALKDFYDKQKEMLRDQYDEEKYLEEQREKRKSVTDIEAQLAQLERDDSAWAQRRKLELQEELIDARAELQEFEDEHALDAALDALDNAFTAQESQIQAEMDALDDRLNDPHALFNRALNDIESNTGALYNEMLIYNRKYGSGNDEDIADMYIEAQNSLAEYKKLYGSSYKGISLNSTSGSGSSGSSSSSSSSSSGSISKGDTVTVKKTATHYGSNSGSGRMASFVPGGTYTVYKTSSDQVLIGRNGTYTGWVKKSDIVGYASGTSYAIPGFKRVDESGAEYTFVSSDGSKYRVFSGGEKVLNAKATNFLYDFATTGGSVISNMMSSLIDAIGLGKVTRPSQAISLSTGDIIIQGNADHRTVSEIRRAQRDNLEFIIREFNKLNK